jgi:ubiquitin C-terminal hydrolase
MELESYDRALAPAGFGLNNTGAICYFNSFLQALAGCTAFTRAVLQNTAYLLQTQTGTAMLRFVEAFAAPTLAPDIAQHSSRVLGALVADLRERRPRALKNFGGGQSSASEALVLLLDMMEPAGQPFERESAVGEGEALPSLPLDEEEKPTAAIYSIESPITRLFLHRFRCELHCRQCRAVVSTMTDYMVMFNLFHFDLMPTPPRNAGEFAKALRRHIVKVEDYTCEKCKTKTTAYRVHSLTMVPEILFCAFNLYDGYGRGGHRSRYFPERLDFPAVEDETLLEFRLVGQIEHSGSTSGGHYWAHALRSGEQVFTLNDTGVSRANFGPRANTYIIAYHYAGNRRATQ